MKNSLVNTADFYIQIKSNPGEPNAVNENLPYGVMADRQQGATARKCQSGKFYSRFAPYIAFVIAVLVSFIAAVTVASHDLPFMLGVP